MKNQFVWREEFSKYLSYLLRHHPEDLNLSMDKQGWVSVDELLNNLKNQSKDFKIISFEILKNIVNTNNKKRFIIENRNGQNYIRANQGHSLKNIDLGLECKRPPDILYHGTGEKYVSSILKKGLIKKSRQHVHLSLIKEIAEKIGLRHGNPVIFIVDSKQMFEDGCIFYLSENGVWLTDFVDKKYLKIEKG